MKQVKRIISAILVCCLVVCATSVPVYAKEERTAYDYIMENGYPTLSTETFFSCLESVDEVVFLITGRHFISQEKFNVVFDDMLSGICSDVAEDTGFDAAMIAKNLPNFNSKVIDVAQRYDIDTEKMQEVLRDIAQFYYERENKVIGNIFWLSSAFMGIVVECYFYCVPVEGMDNTYEMYCQLTYRDGETDQIASGTYYNTQTKMLYGKNEDGLLGVGFDLKVDEVFLTAPVNGWMRNFGFCLFYDIFCYITPFLNYNTTRIKFEYDNTEWMFQLWKGRYVVTNGGEVGIYKRKIGSKGTYYNCADDEDMLLMSLDIYHGDDVIVHRDPTMHWWITGFVISDTVYLPQSLTLKSDITLKDAEMAKAFCEGIENQSADIEYKVDGLTVSIEW